MKTLLVTLALFTLTTASGQDIKTIDKKLNQAFSKINYWAIHKTLTANVDPYDSLEKANALFENLLLQCTATNLQTLSHPFKNLKDSGLVIVTSTDGLFRIYSWDTWTGGTMHIYRTVFQYKANGKVFSKAADSNKDNGDAGCIYYGVNDITANNKKYYITQSTARLSSGLSYHNIKLFSINDSQLNDTAKCIKTKTGIQNELGYEVDLGAKANQDGVIPDFTIKYDTGSKTIILPLILENSKITAKKIRYQFKGMYFEKL